MSLANVTGKIDHNLTCAVTIIVMHTGLGGHIKPFVHATWLDHNAKNQCKVWGDFVSFVTIDQGKIQMKPK
jgi:hypothetical protein